MVLAAIGIATPAAASGYRLLHSFAGGADGANPEANLLDVGGKLYGTTAEGGNFSQGTVFVVNAKTGAVTIVHAFGGAGDGVNPLAGVINVAGTLYGTTNGGGVGYGAVYSLNPKTGEEMVRYSFEGFSDGGQSNAGLLKLGKLLFGTTAFGGTGTAFSFDPAADTEMVLHAFQGGSDGGFPDDGLINVGGTLYGTTSQGGSGGCRFGCGTVFSINPKTGRESVVYNFMGGSDGATPLAGLISIGGTIFGTTVYGGAGACADGCGTVFSFNLQTGVETVLHSFVDGSDGSYPVAGLVDVNGTLYGTTEVGGPFGYGTVFSIDPVTGSEAVLYSFGGNGDGIAPQAALINAGGTLYGTTNAGGAGDLGTVFAYTP